MIRYTITLPVTDNDGNSLTRTHHFLERQLLGAFGAFTMHDATGRWSVPVVEADEEARYLAWQAGDQSTPFACRGNAQTYQDQNIVYTVDTNRYHADAYRIIRNLAIEARKDADQEAVYVTWQDIQTCLITDDARPDYSRQGAACIKVAFIGGSEAVNFEDFSTDIIQDEDVAARVATDLLTYGEYVWNEDEPEYRSVFTVTDAAALRRQLKGAA